MNLTTRLEKWRVYWATATDLDEVERRVRNLRWLDEFAFHSGPAISAEQYAALQQQIETGEARLCELGGAKTPAAATLEAVDCARQDLARNLQPKRTDFAAEEVPA